MQECWAAEPQRRPTFEAIAETLRAMYPKTKEWPHPDEAARAAVAAAKSDADREERAERCAAAEPEAEPEPELEAEQPGSVDRGAGAQQAAAGGLALVS